MAYIDKKTRAWLMAKAEEYIVNSGGSVKKIRLEIILIKISHGILTRKTVKQILQPLMLAGKIKEVRGLIWVVVR